MRRRRMMIAYLRSYIGAWYKWGGDDPAGFDCSGLVVEGLKAVGIMKRKTDMTANGMWHTFTRVDKPQAGCLVCYGTGDKATHIEVCLDGTYSLGASGGGSATLTPADAIKQNAFVKQRPIRSRDNILGYVDPFI